MSAFSEISIVAAVLILVFTIVLVIGVVLFIKSFTPNKDGRRSKGKMAAGIVMMVVGFFLGLVSLLILIFSGISNAVFEKPEVKSAAAEVQQALEDNDLDALCDMLAEKGMEGDAITAEDIDKLYKKMGSDIDDEVTTTLRGYHINNSVQCVSFEYGPFTTKDGDMYTISVDYVIESSRDEYEGIQYIKLRENGKNIFEAGEHVEGDQTYKSKYNK